MSRHSVLTLLLLVFSLFAVQLSASEITLSADKSTLSKNDTVTVEMSVIEDGEGSFSSMPTPHFSDFSVINQSQTSSSSFSFVNGRTSSKKVVTFIYELSPKKIGQLTIPAVTGTLENGKTVHSNSLSFIVTKGVSATVNPLAPVTPPSVNGQKDNGISDEDASSDEDTVSTQTLAPSPQFDAPLSRWEARTGRRYFVRVFVRPLGNKNAWQGMPFEVSYYLYTRRNAISDLNVQQYPTFSNAWVEDVSSPKRLRFKSIQIGNALYDYALMKSYLVIPDRDAETLESTQMIVTIMTGGFFGRTRRVSSIALSVPLHALPDAGNHSDAVFGDFQLTAQNTHLLLNKNHLIDSIVFTAKGCGNIAALDVKLQPVAGLKLFPPDVKTAAHVVGGRYCGTKTFTFMVKGEKKGEYSVKPVSFELFDGTSYRSVSASPVSVTVNEAVVAAESVVSKNRSRHAFEFLPSLPAGVAVYSTGNFTDSLLFRVSVVIPVVVLLSALMIAVIGNVRRKRRGSFARLRDYYLNAVSETTDATVLLNLFYEALHALYSIDLKGARKQDVIELLGEQGEALYRFVRDLQAFAYGGVSTESFDALKSRARNLLTAFGEKR